jgi:putative oxidoreductase
MMGTWQQPGRHRRRSAEAELLVACTRTSMNDQERARAGDVLRGGPGLDRTGQVMESIGFSPGRRHAAAAGLVEVAGGLLMAIGWLTPLAAALIASVMLVAAIAVHVRNGFFITSGGYEFNLVLGVAALAVAFTGPGTLSVDAFVGYAPSGVVWGVGAATVAVLGALAQLARRVSPVASGGRAGRAVNQPAH